MACSSQFFLSLSYLLNRISLFITGGHVRHCDNFIRERLICILLAANNWICHAGHTQFDSHYQVTQFYSALPSMWRKFDEKKMTFGL